MSRLKCKESIADLWGYPDTRRPRRPSTEELFKAIAAEAEMCLRRADWEPRIRRIENIISVIRWRIRRHWEEKHASDLDKLFSGARKKAKEKEFNRFVESLKKAKESDTDVG